VSSYHSFPAGPYQFHSLSSHLLDNGLGSSINDVTSLELRVNHFKTTVRWGSKGEKKYMTTRFFICLFILQTFLFPFAPPLTYYMTKLVAKLTLPYISTLFHHSWLNCTECIDKSADLYFWVTLEVSTFKVSTFWRQLRQYQKLALM